MATAQVAPVRQEASQAKQRVPSPIDAYLWLRCKTTAEIPVPGFTVGHLLNLRVGNVVKTATPVANDVPVKANNIPLAWGRFEVAGERLVVRITELV